MENITIAHVVALSSWLLRNVEVGELNDNNDYRSTKVWLFLVHRR
jgi:hypothetical protein